MIRLYCSGAREIYDPAGHGDIQLARGIGVDHGRGPDAVFESCFVEIVGQTDHLERLRDLPAPSRIDEKRLRAVGELLLHQGIVAEMNRHILWLGTGSVHVDHVEALLEAQRFDKALPAAGPPPAQGIGDIWTARAGHEQCDPRLEDLLVRRIGSAKSDATWCRRECSGDHVASDTDHLRVVVTQSTRGTEDRPRLVQKNADAKVFKHAKRSVVHRGDLVR